MHPPAPEEEDVDGIQFEDWDYNEGYYLGCVIEEIARIFAPSPYVGSISAPHEFDRRRRQLEEIAEELKAYAPHGMNEGESHL